MSTLLQDAERAESMKKNLHYTKQEKMLALFLKRCGIKDSEGFNKTIHADKNNRPTASINPFTYAGPITFTVIEMDWGSHIEANFIKLQTEHMVRCCWFSNKVKKSWTKKYLVNISWPVDTLASLAPILRANLEAAEWKYSRMSKSRDC